MPLLDFLFGPPLRSDADREERIGPAPGVAIFGLDALSSAAYGPEAALTLLLPLGAAGVAWILPISVSVVVLMSIVYFSYRQTIEAYPNGGGSYTVASENLGMSAGLLAAAALMIDYVLTAAVGISSGVGALISALPNLQPHTLSICLGILVLLTILNLRGVREAGGVFMYPTWLFVACLLGMILIGVVKVLFSGGHPKPVIAPPGMPVMAVGVSAWLILKAFASGCTAMTGVEAVSNGVRAFRDPVSKTAQFTLTIIIAILAVMLLGIAFLVRAYHIGATEPGSAGYQSVLSMLLGAVAGRGWFYWVSISSITLVLCLSANTAYADFPRLCRIIAQNGYLPYTFSIRGRRLVFSQGVYVLAFLAALLLTVFGGVTDRLIPLYAVGAFLAFTLSQAGMVGHWRKSKERAARRHMIVNGIGAVATGITVCVVLVAKFADGAWITVLLIPTLIGMMVAIHRHFQSVAEEIKDTEPLSTVALCEPLVIVPIDRWSKISERGLRFALSLSKEIKAVHVQYDEGNDELVASWQRMVVQPVTAAGLPVPELIVLASPFRYVLTPIVDCVLALSAQMPEREIAVVVPELVEYQWYHFALHNKRAEGLKALLLLKGNPRITIMNIPWYLKGVGGRTRLKINAVARAAWSVLTDVTVDFGQIVAENQSLVFSFALRFLRNREGAEELAQDVFLQLYEKLRQIESPAHATWWLRRAICHRCIDEARKRRLRPRVGLESAPEPVAEIAETDLFLNERLRGLIADLPENARAVMLLRYQEDLDPTDIATMLDMPVRTVKSHLHRSLAVLRGRLQKQEVYR